MKWCFLLLSLLLMCGCGSGSDSTATSQTSGVWVSNAMSSGNNYAKLTITSSDDVNYTGTLEFTDYSTTVPKTTIANISGRFKGFSDPDTPYADIVITGGPQVKVSVFYGGQNIPGAASNPKYLGFDILHDYSGSGDSFYAYDRMFMTKM